MLEEFLETRTTHVRRQVDGLDEKKGQGTRPGVISTNRIVGKQDLFALDSRSHGLSALIMSWLEKAIYRCSTAKKQQGFLSRSARKVCDNLLRPSSFLRLRS